MSYRTLPVQTSLSSGCYRYRFSSELQDLSDPSMTVSEILDYLLLGGRKGANFLPQNLLHTAFLKKQDHDRYQ